MRPKTVVGWTCIHVVCPTHDGAERQNPLSYFTDGAQGASFGRRLKRDDSSRPSSDGPVIGDQLTCGAFESSYYRVRSAVPRHCVVTHELGTTTARIISRDLE